jgi:hypothetical protein
MINTYACTFNVKMEQDHIYAFRGAFLDLVRHSSILLVKEQEILTNKVNHPDGKVALRETYPLLQFRCVENMALIWAVNEGVDILKKIISSGILDHFTIEQNLLPLVVVREEERESLDDIIDEHQKHHYTVLDFAPFNQEKKAIYAQTNSYIEKIQMMQQLLLNELVLLTYALKFKNDKLITVEILDMVEKGKRVYTTKNGGKKIYVEVPIYTIKISTNMKMPCGVSIGRHKAYGYGVVKAT